MKNKILVLNLILLAGISLTAAGKDLQSNYDAAKKSATERGLPIFAYFSVSSKMECTRFNSIILQDPEFQKYASSNLIMFQVDFSAKPPVTDEIKKQRQALLKLYGISDLPVVLLLNAKGEIIATINYDKGGPAVYIQKIKSILGK